MNFTLIFHYKALIVIKSMKRMEAKTEDERFSNGKQLQSEEAQVNI